MRAYLSEPEAVREVDVERRGHRESLKHTTKPVSMLASYRMQRRLSDTHKEVEDEE